jgi:hypothetical protein
LRGIDKAAADYLEFVVAKSPKQLAYPRMCNTIDSCMTWADTPQGHEYWNDLDSIIGRVPYNPKTLKGNRRI